MAPAGRVHDRHADSVVHCWVRHAVTVIVYWPEGRLQARGGFWEALGRG